MYNPSAIKYRTCSYQHTCIAVHTKNDLLKGILAFLSNSVFYHVKINRSLRVLSRPPSVASENNAQLITCSKNVQFPRISLSEPNTSMSYVRWDGKNGSQVKT